MVQHPCAPMWAGYNATGSRTNDRAIALQDRARAFAVWTCMQELFDEVSGAVRHASGCTLPVVAQ